MKDMEPLVGSTDYGKDEDMAEVWTWYACTYMYVYKCSSQKVHLIFYTGSVNLQSYIFAENKPYYLTWEKIDK